MENLIFEFLHVLIIIFGIYLIKFFTTNHKKNKEIDLKIKQIKESKEHLLNYQEIINLKGQKQKGKYKTIIITIIFLIFYFSIIFRPSAWFLLYFIPLKILFHIFIYKEFIGWYYD